MTTRTLTALIIALAACSTRADVVSTVASVTATIRPDGVRTGSNGLRFLDVEGNDNGSFASFAVADFPVGGLGLQSPVADVDRLTVKLYASLSSFSANGPVDVFLTNATSVSIAQDGSSPLVFDAASLPNGLGLQLETKWKLGTVDFVIGMSGDETRFDATTLPAGALNYLRQQLNSGTGKVRIALAPGANGTAASWAGVANTSYPVPTLELDVTYGTLPTVSGKLTFGDRLDRLPTLVDIDFLDAGDPSNVVYTAKGVAVDSHGVYSTTDLPPTPGTYIVSVQVGSWLRENGATVDTSTGASAIDLVLTNGDVDRDNAITVFDYNALSDAFDTAEGDTNWNPLADLDGDGAVTVFDYNIISAHFDQVGD